MNADELQAAANAAYVKAAPGHMVVASGLQAAIEVAVAAERERCAKIVLAARMGEIDQGFRFIHHRIKSGDPFPSTEPE